MQIWMQILGTRELFWSDLGADGIRKYECENVSKKKRHDFEVNSKSTEAVLGSFGG